jgi:hypothetical protein
LKMTQDRELETLRIAAENERNTQNNAAKIQVAVINAKVALSSQQQKTNEDAALELDETMSGIEDKPSAVDKLAEMHAQSLAMHQQTLGAIGAMIEQNGRPKELVRDANGRAAGVRTL